MKTPIQIIKKDIWNVNHFTFIWAIDESNADETFKNVFHQFIWTELIFDLWLLTYGNSKFIWYLSKMYEFIEEKNWQMYIVNCVEPIRDILDICWILKIIPNSMSLNEALENMWEKEEILTK